MKKIKSVAFNDKNTEEKAMLTFTSRRNFSKYVKQLIKADMQEKGKVIPPQKTVIPPTKPLVNTKPNVMTEINVNINKKKVPI